VCWTWIGSRNRDGYGQFKLNGKLMRPHRVAYELAFGPIPPGAQILHSCDNPSCCNPNHLRTGTHQDNMDDKAERGRARSGGPKKKDRTGN
jgi:hypothetical protein